MHNFLIIPVLIKLTCNTFFKFEQKIETERPHANNKQQLLNVFPGVNRLMKVAEREQDINRRRTKKRNAHSLITQEF